MDQQNYTNFNQNYQPEKLVSTKKSLLRKLLVNSKQHKWSIFAIAAFSIASLVLVVLLNGIELPVNSWQVTPHKRPDPVYYSALSGLKVNSAEEASRPITAIMIENSPSARPQSGIGQAEVVFEAIAEAGITRFLTIFQVNQPALVGPVRSVRQYYVDWVAPFQASVAHVGGSAAALAEIRNGNYRDIDQFFNSSFYWRATDRSAPHNVYTSFEKMNALNASKGYTSSNPTVWARQDPKPAAQITATQINFKISSATYNSAYTYDGAKNQYSRFLAGKQHLDRENGAIMVDAAIGIKVNETTVLEDGNREQIQTVGSGEAYIFQNGEVIQATWKKPARAEQIKFYLADSSEVKINRGKVWITAIPSNSGNVTWQ